MALTPFFRLPLTDLTGCLVNHQTYDKCGELEMNMMECLEAYGGERGKKMCKDLIDDFGECVNMRKQMLRVEAMRKERFRQYRAGERKKEELYAESPRIDAY
ncbi:NADH dehydrogenase [ubiquinone] iron-sulfur protein 5 [Glossina fuscipes]|uniref:NADH dehydrogenase [ubiquinone] iron-sulfur protein 5 n=2 Tax=Nemorhina TaxID=44051 RepID=A0A8U0WF02_9MUSC|nr:NADH dehydrogenase [ubiquinone] iron-sulfur protein 5 [Glossina fuscipes]KAI9585760.1 hypothetical protein GQX74_001607 [Glossina fuscipes]